MYKIFSGTVICLIGVGLFYEVFWKLVPYIAGLLPINQWKPILSAIVYVFVGWVGGLGMPVFLFCIGVYLIICGCEG